MPYYGNHYPGEEPFQYYPQEFTSPRNASIASSSQMQVVTPQRQAQGYLQPLPHQPNYYPIQQPQYTQYSDATSQYQTQYHDASLNHNQYYNQQAFVQNNQQMQTFEPQYNSAQTYKYPQHYQQHFQPQPQSPQQTRVIVPPPQPQVQASAPPSQSQQYQPPQAQVQVNVPPPRKQPYQPPPPPKVIVPPAPSQTSTKAQQTLPPPKEAASSSVQMPTKHKSNQSRVLQDAQANTPRQQIVTKESAPAPPSIPSTQYPAMLIALADEYLEASKKLENRTKEYYQLVSTALGCMEVALKNFKLSPLREAQLSLQYAQVLYDETNNLDEAETTLTKAIDLCDKMKFTDLKYAMQLLLARVLFRSKPRAARVDLQGMISDIETYRHTAWEYSFRFQAVSFDLETADFTNLHDAVYHLQRVEHLAKQHTDYSIYAFACLVESLLHLRDTGGDRLTHAQTALANARSLQLNPDVEHHPQMVALVELLDIICHLETRSFDVAHLDIKRKNMAQTITAVVQKNSNWSKDESIWLRIKSSSLRGIATQDCGLVQEVDGKHYIALSWIGKLELEAITYLMNGICMAKQNAKMYGRAEEYLNEGYMVPDTEMANPPAAENASNPQKPITIKNAALRDRTRLLAAQFQIERVLLQYMSGKANDMPKALAELERHLKEVKNMPEDFKALLEYLRGCVQQSNGNLNTALKHYQSSFLVLHPKQENSKKITQQQKTVLQLQILAAMNTALIIHSPSHPLHNHLDPLFSTISSHDPHTISTLISSAWNFIISTFPHTGVLNSQRVLTQALNEARDIKHYQLCAFALAFMQDRFFRGGVQHDQAVKSAKAAAHMVRDKFQHNLWWAVAGEMEIESLLLQRDPNKREEIERRKLEVRAAWEKVPEKVRAEMQRPST